MKPETLYHIYQILSLAGSNGPNLHLPTLFLTDSFEVLLWTTSIIESKLDIQRDHLGDPA